jgi:dynein heavy chain
MNPGYAGRTELPENLKAQFRYCAMVVPDMVLICENMLMSEGFNTAKELAKQFMTLYDLCKSLLSGQVHYDWGLRAVKSLLRSAGGLKRADL